MEKTAGAISKIYRIAAIATKQQSSFTAADQSKPLARSRGLGGAARSDSSNIPRKFYALGGTSRCKSIGYSGPYWTVSA